MGTCQEIFTVHFSAYQILVQSMKLEICLEESNSGCLHRLFDFVEVHCAMLSPAKWPCLSQQ